MSRRPVITATEVDPQQLEPGARPDSPQYSTITISAFDFVVMTRFDLIF